MEEVKRKKKIWVWFKGMHGYAVFNDKFKYISHYEPTRIEAVRCCNQWNREQREF